MTICRLVPVQTVSFDSGSQSSLNLFVPSLMTNLSQCVHLPRSKSTNLSEELVPWLEPSLHSRYSYSALSQRNETLCHVILHTFVFTQLLHLFYSRTLKLLFQKAALNMLHTKPYTSTFLSKLSSSLSRDLHIQIFLMVLKPFVEEVW